MSGETPACGPQGDKSGGKVRRPVRRELLIIAVAAILFLGPSALEGAFPLGLTLFTVVAGVIVGLLPYRIMAAKYRTNCEEEGGIPACWAGVVTDVEESFSSWWHYVLPWASNHPYADVVVKRDYWHLVTTDTDYIHCDAVDPRGYVLRTYFYDSTVCKILRILTQTDFGGNLAALSVGLGLLLGWGFAAAAAAAVGCASVVGCFVVLPLLFILIALITALLLLLVAAIVGNIIRLATSSESEPTTDATDPAAQGDDATEAAQSQAIAVGDLVTVLGDVYTHPDFDGANVGWFAESVHLHGRATSAPPYSHEDPDADLPVDSCPET